MTPARRTRVAITSEPGPSVTPPSATFPKEMGMEIDAARARPIAPADRCAPPGRWPGAARPGRQSGRLSIQIEPRARSFASPDRRWWRWSAPGPVRSPEVTRRQFRPAPPTNLWRDISRRFSGPCDVGAVTIRHAAAGTKAGCPMSGVMGCERRRLTVVRPPTGIAPSTFA